MSSYPDRSSSMEQGLLRNTDEEKLTLDNQGYSQQQHENDDTSTAPTRPQTKKMATSRRLLLVLVGLVLLMGLVNARPCMEAIQTGSVRLKTTFEKRQVPPNSSTPIGQPGQTGQPGEGQPGNQDPTNNNPPANGSNPPGQDNPGNGNPGQTNPPGNGNPGQTNPPGQGNPGDGNPGNGNPGQGASSTSTLTTTEVSTVTPTSSSSSTPADTPSTTSTPTPSPTPSSSSSSTPQPTPSTTMITTPTSTSTPNPPPETTTSDGDNDDGDDDNGGIPISVRKTITIGHITTSSAVPTTFVSTQPGGGITTVTSTSWVAIVPTSADSAEDPDLQNDAPGGRAGVALAAVGGAVVGAMLMI